MWLREAVHYEAEDGSVRTCLGVHGESPESTRVASDCRSSELLLLPFLLAVFRMVLQRTAIRLMRSFFEMV